jgi:dynein heavy chain
LLLQVALEDSLVTMSTILASRFVAGIRSEVERVEKQLNVFSDTLDQWVQVRAAHADACNSIQRVCAWLL